MSEKQIESRMVREIKNRGGLCYKFVSPNNPGVPDRIVITPDGRIIFVELKTEVGRLSKIQQWQREQLKKRGVDIRVIHGWDKVKEFIEEVIPSGIQTS